MTIEALLEMADMSLEQFGRHTLGYTELQGDHPHLRELIAAAYSSTQPDDVFVLGAPIEGIYLAARALVDPDDEAIVLTPAYDALINMFEHVAGVDHVKKWTFHAAPTTWKLRLDDLRNLITSKTKMVVVNFPHNPIGYLPSQNMQSELFNIIEEHDL